MPTFERHVFVCENERPADSPRGCCKSKGAAEVRQRFKDLLDQRGMKGRVRANMAGCLDQCALGVTVVVYPDAVWYGRVTVADVEEIVERHVMKGEVVERLRIKDEILNTPAAVGVKKKH